MSKDLSLKQTLVAFTRVGDKNITPVASLWFRFQSVFHAITLKTPKNKVYMPTRIKVSSMHHRNSNPQLIKMINRLVLNIS